MRSTNANTYFCLCSLISLKSQESEDGIIPKCSWSSLPIIEYVLPKSYAAIVSVPFRGYTITQAKKISTQKFLNVHQNSWIAFAKFQISTWRWSSRLKTFVFIKLIIHIFSLIFLISVHKVETSFFTLKSFPCT